MIHISYPFRLSNDFFNQNHNALNSISLLNYLFYYEMNSCVITNA